MNCVVVPRSREDDAASGVQLCNGVEENQGKCLLALKNFLVQLHILMEAPKRHLTNLGGTTLQKVIDVGDDDELLALVLQMIISPTLNSPH